MSPMRNRHLPALLLALLATSTGALAADDYKPVTDARLKNAA